MARVPLISRRRRQIFVLLSIHFIFILFFLIISWWYYMSLAYKRTKQLKISKKDRNQLRIENLYKIIVESDIKCISQLRMDRRTFYILCEMVRDIGGLRGTRNMSIEEIVALFLYTLAHHQKNRTIGNYFDRSGETVSRQFHLCLKAVLKLHKRLLKNPEPIDENCTNDIWRPFKVCWVYIF